MAKLILSVDSVQMIDVPNSNPPAVYVVAHGRVTTSGWKNADLVPRGAGGLTPDGFLDFDFVADPPPGISLQVISPVTGDVTAVKPAGFKGVRVYATRNMDSVVVDEAPKDPVRSLPTFEDLWTRPTLESIFTGLRSEHWPPTGPGIEVPPWWPWNPGNVDPINPDRM